MLTDHRSKFAKRGKCEMCSFGSCQTSFEFLSQFRKVRNAFECFVTQVQTLLPKTKRVWPMKINMICTVLFILWRMQIRYFISRNILNMRKFCRKFFMSTSSLIRDIIHTTICDYVPGKLKDKYNKMHTYN